MALQQIGEDAQRFQEISTDRAAPQLRPEDEHGGISEVTHIPAAVPPNYTTSVANNHQLIRSESGRSHSGLRRYLEIEPPCISDQRMAKELLWGALGVERRATSWMNPLFLVGQRRKRAS
jgi:hypothetical protein